MAFPEPAQDRTSGFTVSEANAFASGLAMGLWLLAIASWFLFFHFTAIQKQSEPIILRMSPEPAEQQGGAITL